jgi:stalled ribosome alternative rescue factor ArfA
MNWTKILSEAGIPEPPDRDAAIEQAIAETAARYEKVGKKRAKGSTTRKTKKVARVDYNAMKHNAKNP